MTSPFQSAFELFAWSTRHFELLNAHINDWAENTNKVRISDVDPETGETVYKFRFSEPFPWEFGCMAFDAINTQRAVLDQIMFAAAVALAGGNPDGTKFPFGDTAEKALKDGTRKASALPHRDYQEILACALAFKPYEHGGTDLWALNKIRNMKHHRLLSPTAVSAQNLTISNGVFFGGGIRLANKWDGYSNELTYLRTGASLSNHDSEITVSVAFDQGTVASGRLVTEFLSATAVIVQNIFKAIEKRTFDLLEDASRVDFPLLSKDFP